MEIPKNIKPLFILSIHRSGSTLLQSLLDGHPQLLVDVADSRFFRHYFPISRKVNPEDREQLAENVLISHIFNPDSSYYQDFLSFISIEELKAQFRLLLQETHEKPKDVLESYIYALGLASKSFNQDIKYWVDKTLRSEYSYRLITSWWPQAQFIYLLRDPRDVYASYKQRDIKNNRNQTPLDAFVFAWSNAIITSQKVLHITNSSRCLLLTYEQLVTDLESSISLITKFLAIDDHPILYKPTKGHGRVNWGGNPASGNKTEGVTNTRIAKWKFWLTDTEVKQIESLLRSEMKSFGYEPVNNPDTLSSYTSVKLKNEMRKFKYHFTYSYF